MREKFYHQLTEKQKVKVTDRVLEAFKRTVSTIDFNECLNDEDRKYTILNDSIDIYYKPVSNIFFRACFKVQLIDLFKTNNKLNYISSKL